MTSWNTIFHEHFDHAICGSGLAACAAALHLRGQGRSVALIAPHGDIAWEWSRAYTLQTGSSSDPLWTGVIDRLRQVGALTDTPDGPVVDGAAAELVLLDRLRQAGVALAFMVWPVGTGQDGTGRLQAVACASKDGLRRISAASWIDASEVATLHRLVGGRAPQVAQRTWHYRWQICPGATLPADAGPDGARLGPGAIAGEWDLALTGVAESQPHLLLDRWDALPASWQEALGNQLLGQASLRSLDTHVIAEPTAAPIANLALAVPGLHAAEMDPSERWQLGLAAAQTACDHPQAEPPRSTAIPSVEVIEDIDTEVAVVGLGTGGPLAALAAAEAGARVVAVEPFTVPGGVGTIAGIHVYCGGVDGGRQHGLNTEVAAWMEHLSIPVNKTRHWHPDVKAWVLDLRLQQAGVDRHYDSLLWAVETEDRRITAAMIATPGGAVRLRADNWIDSTGDGDLCARAGADHYGGREHDGRTHAYTQSARLIQPDAEGIPRMATNNFDSGWVDPVDPADWTRARCEGLAPYIAQLDDAQPQRYAAMCPTIGIRQSRQIVCRRILRIDDLLARHDLEDAIGYGNCGIDNHSQDIAFESDDFLSAAWVHAKDKERTLVVALPYGMVVPRDLDNAWIACRACGVDQHSHYPIRMMRDIQRLGEACGLAAALCRDGTANHAVDREHLRAGLTASGALERHDGKRYGVFGFKQFGDVNEHLGHYDRATAITAGRASLAAGKAHLGMRWMLQELDAHRKFLSEQLASDDLEVVWLAAGLLGVAGDPAAGERLLQLWRERIPGGGGHPHWYRALVLLRCCGTAAHLRQLGDCLPPEPVIHDVAVALLLTAARIRERHPDAQGPALRILDWAQQVRVVGSRRPPLYGAADQLKRWQAGEAIPERIVTTIGRAKHVAAAFHVDDDSSWQVHLTRARLALACDGDAEADLRILHEDERAYVRQAAQKLVAQSFG